MKSDEQLDIVQLPSPSIACGLQEHSCVSSNRMCPLSDAGRSVHLRGGINTAAVALESMACESLVLYRGSPDVRVQLLFSVRADATETGDAEG